MIRLPDEYTERDAVSEIDMVSRMYDRFKNTGVVMPESQRKLYANISQQFVEDVKRWRGYPKQIHMPTVVDVGCGVGIGSNILSQEAQFVWGIDINEDSINLARQLFTRDQNHIYYTPQLTFDVVNILSDNRDFMYFDYVVCIEVIEHIPRTQATDLLKALNRFVKRNKQGALVTDDSRTKIYLSTPNRNNPDIQDTTPRNEHHYYEASAGEMYEFLTQHYRHVTVLNEDMQPKDLDTTDTPLLFKLEVPLDA